MAALHSLTGAASDSGKRSRWPAIGALRKPWASSKELLGVDLGSSLIKAVLLTREDGQIALKQAVVIATPSGVLTAGEMTDALTVGRTLRTVCKEHQLKTKYVAVAVAGDKVYAQSETLPTESEEGLDEFIQDAMMKVIPYSIDRAAFDYESIPQGDGSSHAVLWVSAATEQVEWARETVTLAGKTPAVVDAQACALANAYVFGYGPAEDQTVALVHVGPRVMTLALVRGSMLLSSRDVTLFREPSGSEAASIRKTVMGELEKRWDSLLHHATPHAPVKIYVSGGAAQSQELCDAIREFSGIPVEPLDPFQKISLVPGTESGQIAAEHGPIFAVAVGLALRGFEDL